MQITFLANCGLLLRTDRDSILIDSPNGLHTSFDGLPEEELQKMIHAHPPYDSLKAMFFTHRHSDHFDKKRAQCVAHARCDMALYSTNGATDAEGVVKAGEFTVRYFRVPHSGAEFADVPHCVLLVEAEKKKIYITGDADWNSAVHKKILCDFSPQVAIWNPNYMTHAEGRELLSEVPQNFIYHLPVQADDVFGFGRKCRKDFQSYGKLLHTDLVECYPMTIQL